MAKFLTTKGIASKIEEIIRKADTDVYLVSPYLKLSKTFLERLQDAEEKNVRVHIIYGKDELSKNENNKILALKNIRLYFYQDLHAKCFANEFEILITSMNMHEYSEHNNREMGINIFNNEDDDVYRDAFEEIRSIIKSAEVIKEFQIEESNNKAQGEISVLSQTRLNPDEYDLSDFHLPMVFESLKNEIKNVGVFLKDDRVQVYEFPQSGINMRIDHRVEFDFYSNKYNYNAIKYDNQYKLESLMPGKRIYWNYPKIMIYMESDYSVELTEEGRKSKSDNFLEIIQIVINNLVV